jgi:Zn-dependent membrane protease YugP
MFFDPLYFVFALPALLLGLYAQSRVKGNFNKYSQVRTARSVTGADVARALLDQAGLHQVRIEETQGFLSDHYDPRTKILRLSPQVYRVPSVAAAGVAAHEMGHALQDAQRYAPLALRGLMVPAVSLGSNIGPLIFIIGLMLGSTSLAWVGVILFAGVVLFSLVTLPVEFDASSRAKKLLASSGILYGDEVQGVDKVLDAAALTYVAAAISAIGTLLYFVFRLGGLSNRD